MIKKNARLPLLKIKDNLKKFITWKRSIGQFEFKTLKTDFKIPNSIKRMTFKLLNAEQVYSLISVFDPILFRFKIFGNIIMHRKL